jgi:hypothetical protein
VASTWSKPVSAEEAYRRAGGRRRYNRERQINAILRRVEVLDLLKVGGYTLEQIGALTGTSTSTAARDVHRLMRLGVSVCPQCNTVHRTSRLIKSPKGTRLSDARRNEGGREIVVRYEDQMEAVDVIAAEPRRCNCNLKA